MNVAKAAGLWIAVSAGAGCTHAGGALPVDAPKLVPYKSPDIDEITGIDSEEEDTAPATPAAAPAKPANPPAQNQHK